MTRHFKTRTIYTTEFGYYKCWPSLTRISHRPFRRAMEIMNRHVTTKAKQRPVSHRVAREVIETDVHHLAVNAQRLCGMRLPRTRKGCRSMSITMYRVTLVSATATPTLGLSVSGLMLYILGRRLREVW